MRQFVSRAGLKLDHALDQFKIDLTQRACADLGCNAGGFTDCLLQRGAARVFAIDTGYGMFDYSLRKNARVILMERTNALHVMLPEPIDLIVIDVAWTKQQHILPAAKKMLKPDGLVISLVKPHYEADASQLRAGILPADQLDDVMSRAARDISTAGFELIELTQSPIKGQKGNAELLAHLRLTR